MNTLTMIKIIAVFLLIFFIFANIFVSYNSPSKIVEEKIVIKLVN